MSTQKLAESYAEAELLLRMVIYGYSRELIGYQSAKEVLAFLKRENINAKGYPNKKTEALKEALKKVEKYPYLKKGVATRITTPEDVELSIKELLRASGIMSSVDEFILELIGE